MRYLLLLLLASTVAACATMPASPVDVRAARVAELERDTRRADSLRALGPRRLSAEDAAFLHSYDATLAANPDLARHALSVSTTLGRVPAGASFEMTPYERAAYARADSTLVVATETLREARRARSAAETTLAIQLVGIALSVLAAAVTLAQ